MVAVSVTRSLRLLLAALLLAGGTVLVLEPAPALACPAPGRLSLEQQTMRADAVFIGTVAARSRTAREVTFEVEVHRIYKGEVDAQATVTTPAPARACGVPGLKAGSDYVFFGSLDGDRFTTGAPEGTAAASDTLVRRVERLLGEGRSATPPEPVEATFTVIADAPPSLERVAAPGVALVIVGLLGLLLVAGLGRRRG